MFIAVGIFIFIFIFFKNNPMSVDDMNVLLFKKIRSKSIKSIVTKKSIDYTNHGAIYVVYGMDSLPIHTEWEEKIKVGDSILKPKDSLKIMIKSNSGVSVLDYEQNKEEILTTNF